MNDYNDDAKENKIALNNWARHHRSESEAENKNVDYNAQQTTWYVAPECYQNHIQREHYQDNVHQ